MAESRYRERRRQSGFALLVVLWALVLLALIVAHVTATGGTEARIAANLVQSAEAEALADGAISETVFRLSDGSDKGWSLAGEHRLNFPHAEAFIRIEPEAGKINPNLATPELLSALFVAHGVGAQTASHLAAAIADWREPGDTPRPNGAKKPQYEAAGLDHGPPGEPIQSLDELGRILGMTPALLAAIRPDLSLYQNGPPDPRFASATIRSALRSTGQTDAGLPAFGQFVPGQSGTTVTIIARVRLAQGGQFVRRAVIRLGALDASAFKILDWSAEPAP